VGGSERSRRAARGVFAAFQCVGAARVRPDGGGAAPGGTVIDLYAAGPGDAAGGKPADLVLLDVREPWEYATAKIEGSLLLPMGDIPANLQKLDPEAHIVTICHSGVRSMNVAVWLRNHGLEKVQSLRGGIDAWSREIDPNVPRY